MNDRTGRNEPCPCGSGKKYKRCCQGKEPPKPLSTQARASRPSPPSRRPATPAPPPRPRDEWDDWYDRYRVSSFAGKLDMLRAVLVENHPPEFYADIELVNVILELPGALGQGDHETYIAFLEETFASRPEVFNLGADWFVRQMAYAYVRAGRARDISRLLPCLLEDAYQPQEPAFDLVDLLRLAGLDEESRRLTFAMIKQTEREGYVAWAVEEIIEFAVFFLYREAVEAGCTPEALNEVRRQLARIDCTPTEKELTAMLAHRSGTVDRQIEVTELLARDESAIFSFYLLSLDFGRWLTTERRMPPLVADTMRYLVHKCLGEMCGESDDNPLALHQQRLDRYLAHLLGFMSVMHLRAVATLIAMRHFYDFLRSVNLIDEGEHRRTRRICDDLWLQMHRALGDTAPDYAFLNQYLWAVT